LITLKKKIFTLLTASLLTATLAGCGLVEKTPEAIAKTVIAKGDGFKITQKDFSEVYDQKYAPYAEAYANFYGENWREGVNEDILNRLLLPELIDQKVIKDGADEETTEVKKMIEEVISDNLEDFETREKYLAWLEENDYTEETYREEVKRFALRTLYFEKIQSELEPTIEEGINYYNENRASLDSAYGDAINHADDGAVIYHIVIKGTDDASKIKAEEVLAKINSKELTFEEAARQYGEDSTRRKGGLLGPYDYSKASAYPGQNGLDQVFIDFVKPLKVGEISGVVKTQFGYHIITVTELYKKGEFNVWVPIQEMLNARLQVKIDEWKKEFNVKEYADKIQ
jgi:foldase protein PrsA